ncbi:hypothetical protein F5887DRAFT_983449 [Amanita rubescens]|nr:hypothetical protein F5887DRAFT_983449 [Amanita rubescens]
MFNRVAWIHHLPIKVRSERPAEGGKDLHQAVADVQNHCNQKAKEIAKQFNKKPEYIHRLIHSATVFKTTRSPNLFNALVHQKAKEINGNLPEGQRTHLSEIQTLVHDELSEREPTEEEKENALRELREHRETKKKGPHASNFAAVQDLKSTLLHIDAELNNLCERTGSYGFALVSRGHAVHDKAIPGWAASADATLFISEVLKIDVWDLQKKFELWTLTRDQHPNLETLLSMRTECSILISDGLRSITNNIKVIMNYANYDTAIIQKYQVKLVGWPATIAFASPHYICTVDEIRLLRHHLLTREEVKKLADEYAAKVRDGAITGRKRKVRSDKGKPRKRRAVPVVNEDGDGEETGEDEHTVDVDEVPRHSESPRRSRRVAKGNHKSQPLVNDDLEESDGSSDVYEENE